MLGISSNASDTEIKKAYRSLSRKYHPDANVNNPNKAQAEEKFKEVQQAYDAIMKQKEQGYGSGYDSYSGNPFGQRTTTQSGYNQQDTHLQAAANFIRSGHFNEALNVLASIPEKTALWYYLSALANSALGNNVVARDHAQMAANMEPDNFDYRRLVSQMNSGGNWYQNQGRSYGYQSPQYMYGPGCGRLDCCDLCLCMSCCM